MAVWAIADLHLSFGTPGKEMDVFGAQWKNHPEKIAEEWIKRVNLKDLVLVAGDISWANHIEQARADLEWLDRLPGTKLMIRGNHDHWWHSISKVRSVLPSTCFALQNDSFLWNDIAIAGARLWDSDECDYNDFNNYYPPEKSSQEKDEEARIYMRDLARLEMSLKAMSPRAKTRIAMTHYPPIGPYLKETQASKLFERYQIDIVVFGHLHNINREKNLLAGESHIKYYLISADYLNFTPIQIL